MGDSNGEYPLFPKLERLCILGGKMKCLALKHLLETTANQLTHLELLGRDRKELPAPPRPLTRLEYLCVLLLVSSGTSRADVRLSQLLPLRRQRVVPRLCARCHEARPAPDVRRRHFPCQRTTHSASRVRSLGLNGIRPRELTSVFGPQCACTTTLTRLYIIGYAGGLMTVPVIAALASRFVQL